MEIFFRSAVQISLMDEREPNHQSKIKVTMNFKTVEKCFLVQNMQLSSHLMTNFKLIWFRHLEWIDPYNNWVSVIINQDCHNLPTQLQEGVLHCYISLLLFSAIFGGKIRQREGRNPDQCAVGRHPIQMSDWVIDFHLVMISNTYKLME